MQNDWERLGYHVVVGKDYNEVDLKLHTKTCSEYPSHTTIRWISRRTHGEEDRIVDKRAGPIDKGHPVIQGAVARCCKKTYGW
jgi:hypothetical protein